MSTTGASPTRVAKNKLFTPTLFFAQILVVRINSVHKAGNTRNHYCLIVIEIAATSPQIFR